MQTQIIDGKELAKKIQQELSEEIRRLNLKPVLAVILVGDDPASLTYVRHKMKCAQIVGIESRVYHLSPVITQEALEAFVRDLNENDQVDGILVQLPLPDHINTDAVLETIHPDKDADGLHSVNLGKLFSGHPYLVPCTPMACMALIQSVAKKTEGMLAVIIGRSRLVGKPLAQLLLDAQCTVTQAHSRTRNLKEIARQADILISATGQSGLITKDFVKPGALVIDVGINKGADGKLYGDVASDVIGTAGALTPVPGGVGPMTVTMLLKNIVFIARQCHKGLTKRTCVSSENTI